MYSWQVCTAVLLLIWSANAYAQDFCLPAKWAERIRREVEEQRRVSQPSSAPEDSRPDFAAIHWYCRSWTVQVAEALPIDWFLYRQVVQPLKKRDFVPEYVSNVEPVSHAGDLTLLRLSYAPALKPRSIFNDGNTILLEHGQTWLFGGDDRAFMLVRKVSQFGRNTSAELFSRRRVRRLKDQKVCDLFVFELHEFNSNSADWILTKKDYYFVPVAEENGQ